MSNVRIYFPLLVVVLLAPFSAHGQWVQSTGEAGGAVCLVSVPGGAGGNTLFAGSNGVFRSTDNGTSWVATGPGLPSAGVMAIASSGTHLFAGTWGYGVYASNDNGDSWSAVNDLALETSHVTALVATTGGSASSIIVATNDHGVHRTSNNGATWEVADTGLIMLNWACASLAVSPDLPENVFASTDYGVFRSTDDGSHWASTGLHVPIYTIAARSTGGGTGVEMFGGMNNGHVYYYDGTTWSTRDITGPVALGSVKCFTFNGSNVVAGVSYIGGGAFLSTNNGTNWKNVSFGMTWDFYSYVYAYVIIGERIIAATRDGIWWRLIEDLPFIAVINKPASNEVVPSNESYDIRWDASGVDFLRIEFSADSGATYQLVASSVPTNDGIYRWLVPDVLSTKCKIRISSMNTNGAGQIPSGDDLKHGATQNTLIRGVKSGTFKAKGYVLTRFKPNGDYEAFDPALHGWSFNQEGGNMWPQSWWSQFDYLTGIDPYTGVRYPARFSQRPILAKPQNFVDWPLFVRTFGVDNCYKSISSLPVYSPTALKLWCTTKYPDYLGSCFGFALSSILAFDRPALFQQKFPEVGTFQNLHDLPLDSLRRRVISQLYETQLGFQHIQYRKNAVLNHYTPRQVLEDLKTSLLSDTSEHRTLSVVQPRGGHAITPYHLRRTGYASWDVDVYDSNCPTADCHGVVNIDSLGNRFTYAPQGMYDQYWWIFLARPASAYLEPPLIWDGNSGNSSPLVTSYVRLFNGPADIVTITDSLGRTIGYQDSAAYTNLPDGIPIIPLTGGSHPPIGYFVPAGGYSVQMRGFRDSLVRFSAYGSSQMLNYWRPGGVSSESDLLSVTMGLDVGNRDTQTKTVNLESIARVSGSERVFQVLNCPAVQNDSMTIMTPDIDRLMFVNRGPQKDYDLNIELASSSGSGQFTHARITVPANSSHTIVPDWEDLQHQPVSIYQDIGNTGTIHDTLIVENQTTDLRGELTPEIPREFRLEQNYPNPFNPSTTISYQLPTQSNVTLKVFDVLGREVEILVNSLEEPGYKTVIFNSNGLSSGVYYYRLQAGAYAETKKLLLLR
jgi:hypothetical protein